jgi:hypothetical protein
MINWRCLMRPFEPCSCSHVWKCPQFWVVIVAVSVLCWCMGGS